MATATIRAAEPHLLGIPRELRDMIYDNLAASEERVVLSRRLVQRCKEAMEAHINLSPGCALGRCTESPCKRDLNKEWLTSITLSIALHPLGRTCRQLREEFQPLHLAAAKSAGYVFIINNFDFDQIDFVNGAFYLVLREFGICSSVRFQLDRGVVKSATDLRARIYETQKQSNDLFYWVRSTLDPPEGLKHWGKAMNYGPGPDGDRWPRATVTKQYHDIATGSVDAARSMSVWEGKIVSSVFSGLRAFVEADYFRGLRYGSDITIGHSNFRWMEEYIWKPFRELT